MLHCLPAMHRFAIVATLAFVLAGCAAPADSDAPARADEDRPAVTLDRDESAPLAQMASELPNHRVALLGLSRVGRGMLEVRFSLENLATEGEPTDIVHFFASAPDDAGTVADAFIVEPLMEKKYFVLRDAQNRPIASRDLTTLAPGDRVELWARFPLPVGDVKEIEVHLPHVPPFTKLTLPVGPAEPTD